MALLPHSSIPADLHQDLKAYGSWINDQGFPLTDTTCGANDPASGVGIVFIYSPSDLTNPANLNPMPECYAEIMRA
jgi:hypothetical protein